MSVGLHSTGNMQTRENPELSASQSQFRQFLAGLRGRHPGGDVVREGLRTRSLCFGAFDVQTRRACEGRLACTSTRLARNPLAVGMKRAPLPAWSELVVRAQEIAASTGLDLGPHVRSLQRNARRSIARNGSQRLHGTINDTGDAFRWDIAP